jgi:hypothetical protein
MSVLDFDRIDSGDWIKKIYVFCNLILKVSSGSGELLLF